MITAGLDGTVETTVTVADTASALGSGDVPVLGTPRVLALAEAATVAALTGRLGPERTTVGARISLEHTAPTPVGAQVVASAHLTEVVDRRLLFDVTVAHDGVPVATGTVERIIVQRERFLAAVRG